MSNFKQYLKESINQLLNEQSDNPWARAVFGQDMIDFIMRGDYTTPRPPDLHPLDFDGDGVLGSGDIQYILAMWGQPYHSPGQDPEGGGDGEGGGGHRGNGGGIASQATTAFHDPRVAGVKDGRSPASR